MKSTTLKEISICSTAKHRLVWAALLDEDRVILTCQTCYHFWSSPIVKRRGNLTQREAADFLGISARTLRRLSRNGTIPSVRQGKHTYYTEGDLYLYKQGKQLNMSPLSPIRKKSLIGDAEDTNISMEDGK